MSESCTAVTVTGCGSSQLPGVKVSVVLARRGLLAAVYLGRCALSGVVAITVTFAVGARLSTRRVVLGLAAFCDGQVGGGDGDAGRRFLVVDEW